MDRICGFYVSNVHLVTMILPFIKEQIQKEIKIETFFEENLEGSINKTLLNLIISEENKQNILNINWKNTKLRRYSNIESNLKKVVNKKNTKIFLISGSKKYINETNNILNLFCKKNNYTNIKIINCYKVSEFDDNIKDVLDKHEYIINTSGIHQIEEIFENYKKAN